MAYNRDFHHLQSLYQSRRSSAPYWKEDATFETLQFWEYQIAERDLGRLHRNPSTIVQALKLFFQMGYLHLFSQRG